MPEMEVTDDDKVLFAQITTEIKAYIDNLEVVSRCVIYLNAELKIAEIVLRYKIPKIAHFMLSSRGVTCRGITCRGVTCSLCRR